MCLVTVYFDASKNHPKGGTANDPRIMTIAAYLAETKDWRKLRKEWRRELAKDNVPFFHMKDFNHARGVAEYGTGQISSRSPYVGWSLERLNALEQRLHKVINRKNWNGKPRIKAAIASNIVLADYEETLPDDLKDHPQCRSAFILTVANVMNAIAFWANSNNHHEPVHYIFAGGDDDTGDLDKWFSRCFKSDSTTKHFRLSKGFTRTWFDVQWMKTEPAIQMVDCPAYELNRGVIEWSKNDFNPMLLSELRASLSSLCKIGHLGLTLRKPELLQIYADVRANDKVLGF